MKLVKNVKVVKLPRSKGSVASTFRRAIQTAHEQEWSHVVIIGHGKDMGGYRSSSIDSKHLVGMLEECKLDILQG